MRPKEVEEDGRKITKSGCVFLEIAKAKNDGTDRMDWENKIIMKLSTKDIADLVMGVRGSGNVNIFHKVDKPDGTSPSSTLKVEPGTEGTFKWFVGKTVGNDKKFATIYLDQKDMYLTFQMLEAAIPVIHGWVA